jgi:MFS family permease
MSAAQKFHCSSKTLPRSLWALGLVSLFMDVSSEMVHALLPVFLVTALGASAVTVGIVEGIGEATASMCKLFSGWLSDRLGKRKALTVLGYGLGALSKPIFAVAPGVSWVLFARFSDRVGKGIRGAPRDAMIADLVEPELRGAAYGLRQSLDTVGAFIGPLLAIALMVLFANDFRLVFWLAAVPGLLAVTILIVAVREPPVPVALEPAGFPFRRRELRALSAPFWWLVAVSAVLTLARFSEAFLILRAEDLGLPLALIPLVLVIMNLVYAAAAYPIGALSDRIDARLILAAGFLTLILGDIALALAGSLWGAGLGIVLWGLHMGMTQGVLAAMVAHTVPGARRGTAFGLFHFVGGVAVLCASLIAGLLWESIGPSATFVGGALFAAAGIAGLAALQPRYRHE